ncbi:hypothetical protein BFL43_06120 [Williamsia sp. 1135]|nr:hypothetical protein BFL43_06120 [Williamsia sp. 1135]
MARSESPGGLVVVHHATSKYRTLTRIRSTRTLFRRTEDHRHLGPAMTNGIVRVKRRSAMSENLPITVGVVAGDEDYPAVEWATYEAAVRGAPLQIVTVIEDLEPTMSAWRLPAEYCHDVARTAQGVVTEASVVARIIADQAGVRDLDIASQVLKGGVRDKLIAQSADSAMMVFGAHTSSGLRHDPISSALATHARCPVVLVPVAGGATTPQHHIVVGVDGSPASLEAVAAAFDEADRRGAPLMAIHAWQENQLHSAFVDAGDSRSIDLQNAETAVLTEQLAGWRQDYPDVAVSFQSAHGDPVEVLTQFSRDAELLVVGSRGLGGFTGMLLGSTSQRLMHELPCPTLIARHRPDNERALLHRFPRRAFATKPTTRH